MKTLLIEEDTVLGAAIAQNLRSRGHAVEWETSSATSSSRTGSLYDVIVIGAKLGGASPVDILKELRRSDIIAPALVVCAPLEVDQKIRLLDAGADDYLVKPLDLRELEARMRALIRRHGAASACKGEIGDVVLDTAARSISVGGKQISLSRREFRLFELLTSRLNNVIPKERLMDQLFGYAEDVGPNAIELYVSRVRQKLRESTLRIETVRSFGYVARILDSVPNQERGEKGL